MNLISSWKGFQRALADDKAFRRLGLPAGWYLRLFYQGRWAARRGRQTTPEKVAVTVLGKRIELFLGAGYLAALKGIFLEEEYTCAQFFKSPPKRILDLGANIGMAAIYLNMIFPGAEFICLEPDPRNVPLLRKNLELNGVKAKVIEAAVAATAGQLKLRFDENPTCSALESSTMHDLAHTVSVLVQTVPEVMAEAGWGEIDLVKIDIEGTEDELLGKNNSWLERTKAVIMEIHPSTTEERIASYLRPFHLELRRIGFKTEPVYFAQSDGTVPSIALQKQN
jgi:FkbM family methyltransferase